MNLFETVKANVSVPAAAKMYGLQATHHGMIKCPFHDDRHPSMKLNEDYFYCFGCGATGDVVDLCWRCWRSSGMKELWNNKTPDHLGKTGDREVFCA